LRPDISHRQANPDVALTNQGMTGKSFSFENLPADNAVPDVRFGPMTVEFRRSGPTDADIMEQGGLLQKIQVNSRLIQFAGRLQGFSRHQAAVFKNNL
jgi:hypothetical protein